MQSFSVSTTLNYYMLNVMYNNVMGEYLWVLIMHYFKYNLVNERAHLSFRIMNILQYCTSTKSKHINFHSQFSILISSIRH